MLLLLLGYGVVGPDLPDPRGSGGAFDSGPGGGASVQSAMAGSADGRISGGGGALSGAGGGASDGRLAGGGSGDQ